jgi:acetyltransferase-like isoleucine patch superfamily enzyme
MAYLTPAELSQAGFGFLGKNVKISTKASIYEPEKMRLGDHSRIDDFCVVSGRFECGRNVYIGPGCVIAAGVAGITFEDFVGLAYQVTVYSQTDDYSGLALTNPTVPVKFRRETLAAVRLGRHSVIGAAATIMPGVVLAEGTSVGAGSLVHRSTEPWGVYVGMPARRIKPRVRDLLELEKAYLASEE